MSGAFRLVAEDLACERGGRVVFAGVGFRAQAGDLVAITGRNGAGKSSLLRVIAGLVPRTSGMVAVEGREEDRAPAEYMHYCGHGDAVKPALTVRENLAFWRAYFDNPGLELTQALESLAIEHLADLPAAYLSAGQRRRLSLCRLLVSQRPVWLLDEPTSALDTITQESLGRLMQEHLRGGGLILAATHADLGLKPALTLRLGEA